MQYGVCDLSSDFQCTSPNPLSVRSFSAAMVRGSSSDATGKQLRQALRTLNGAELDIVAGDKGRLDKVMASVERAFRAVDEGGLFKQSVLEDAFAWFDKSHKHRFSLAAKQPFSAWTAACHKAVREQLAKENKRLNAQKRRESAKEAHDAKPKKSSAAVATAGPLIMALPSCPPLTLTGQKKWVQVPEEVDEAVLCAAIHGALKVQTITFGSITVTGPAAPAPKSCRARSAAVVDEEAEDDVDEDESEDENEDRPVPSAEKRPASAAASPPLKKRPVAAAVSEDDEDEDESEEEKEDKPVPSAKKRPASAAASPTLKKHPVAPVVSGNDEDENESEDEKEDTPVPSPKKRPASAAPSPPLKKRPAAAGAEWVIKEYKGTRQIVRKWISPLGRAFRTIAEASKHGYNPE